MRWPGRFLWNYFVPLVCAWGLVLILHAYIYPAGPASKAFGPVTLQLKLPGTYEGIEEPLLTVGNVGNATFVYIRILRNARARVGVEFWGYGAWESEAFALPSQDGIITVKVSLPCLYPKEKEDNWAAYTPGRRTFSLSHYLIAVDGVIRLQGLVNYSQPPYGPVYAGANPLGGSNVSNLFTGQVLRCTRP